MAASFDLDHVFSNLSTKEKISLLAGEDFWHTTPLPKHGVPKIRMSDGSSGIRGTRWFEGTRGAALPCGTALAATWDRELLRKAGVLLGEECRAKGVHCWLGPTVNIQRSPLGGRGYESYSEDPYLTGILASEIIQGCESTGVISTIKHLVCNDQEDQKRGLSAIMTDRALRKIYLRPFQIAARDAHPGAIMTAYNKVNGVHVSESKKILQGILRDEWGWDPLVMSDWYGTYSTIEAINAGLDLEMPGDTICRGPLANLAATVNLLKPSTLDKRARRVLEFIRDASAVSVSSEESQRDLPEDRELNLELAQHSIVLLKNDRNILPIPRAVKKIALIGSQMKDASMNSTGATALEPYYTIHPFDAISRKLGSDVKVYHEVGAYTHKMLPLLDNRLIENLKLFMFNEPPSVASREAVDEISMSRTFFALQDYTNPKLKDATFYGSLERDFVPDSTEVWEFGLTVHGTAKLFIDGQLVVDNSTQQRAGRSFFDQGTIEEKGTLPVEAGKNYKLRVEFGSAATSTLVPDAGAVDFQGGGARLGACPQIVPDDFIDRAVKAAADSEYAVICTGLNGEWETEGHDRAHMDLPPYVDQLIARVAEACPRTVVVNRTGMPVAMPWASKVPAIIQAWYGGNESGSSIADVLFGDFNPCGKLPISWPHKLRDNPAYLNFGSTDGRVLFGEDVFVSYRWYEKMEIEPLWRFGHGLSYTQFTVSIPEVVVESLENGRINAVARVMVKNTGHRAGAEILQLYVSALDPSVIRPLRELHGFHKVLLDAGEERQVTIDIDRYAMSFWDDNEEQWCLEKGRYVVSVNGGTNGTIIESESVIDVPKTVWWTGI